MAQAWSLKGPCIADIFVNLNPTTSHSPFVLNVKFGGIDAQSLHSPFSFRTMRWSLHPFALRGLLPTDTRNVGNSRPEGSAQCGWALLHEPAEHSVEISLKPKQGLSSLIYWKIQLAPESETG
eukprot:c18512_g1_i1.p1 GENE.c18512_g1_i1~~c18512_g1_i1.p1  ORF type:complete len:123 (+),score=13.96 c18512_g1_i1:1-369(+)